MRKRLSAGINGVFAWAGLLAFAGGPGDCAAQTRSGNQERLSLSAAIEEARRSPFHAVAVTGSPQLSARRSGVDGATAPGPLWPGPQEESDDAPIVALTFVAAGASHLAATFMFWNCAFNDRASGAGCMLAPMVPLIAVPLPALLAGAGSGRALGSSLVGLALGGVAYVAAMVVTEGLLSNVSLLAATAASSLVHAGVVSAMVRQR